MARVETRRRALQAEDVDVGRESVVDAPAQRLRLGIRFDLEVRDLRERVHAGIGASCAVQLEALGPSSHADGVS